MTPDSLQWLLDHTASAYEGELKATDKLKERISFILSFAITPSAGIAVYLASGLKGEIFSESNLYWFWLPWSLALVFLLIAVFFVAYALLRGFNYLRVPLPSEIVPYFKAHPEPEKALEEAKLALMQEYSDAVDLNFHQNQKRSRILLWSQRLAFFSLILLLFSLGRWVYCAVNTKPDPQSVKIVAPIEIKKDDVMPNSTTPKTVLPVQPQDQNKKQQPAPTSPTINKARPVFPTARIIFDSAETTSPPRITSTLNERKSKKE